MLIKDVWSGSAYPIHVNTFYNNKILNSKCGCNILWPKSSESSDLHITLFFTKTGQETQIIIVMMDCTFLAVRAAQYVWAPVRRNERCVLPGPNSIYLPLGFCKCFSSCRPGGRSCSSSICCDDLWRAEREVRFKVAGICIRMERTEPGGTKRGRERLDPPARG